MFNRLAREEYETTCSSPSSPTLLRHSTPSNTAATTSLAPSRIWSVDAQLRFVVVFLFLSRRPLLDPNSAQRSNDPLAGTGAGRRRRAARRKLPLAMLHLAFKEKLFCEEHSSRTKRNRNQARWCGPSGFAADRLVRGRRARRLASGVAVRSSESGSERIASRMRLGRIVDPCRGRTDLPIRWNGFLSLVTCQLLPSWMGRDVRFSPETVRGRGENGRVEAYCALGMKKTASHSRGTKNGVCG